MGVSAARAARATSGYGERGLKDCLPRDHTTGHVRAVYLFTLAHMTSPDAEPRRWYVLFLLTIIYAINIADRFVISTLIEPIKADLHISDYAVGFLTGSSLAIFYVAAGLPLSVLADRVNRRNLVAWSLGAWSLMTVVCGFTHTFWQLMTARVLVGVGEAGGTPPSQLHDFA